MRLSRAEKIQVRTIEQQNSGHLGVVSSAAAL
jgi:hypothetical protein